MDEAPDRVGARAAGVVRRILARLGFVAVGVTAGMPLVVELGISFDVMLAVLILGIAALALPVRLPRTPLSLAIAGALSGETPVPARRRRDARAAHLRRGGGRRVQP